MKLGKLPARENSVKLKFAKYANLSVLPTPPVEFGHDESIVYLSAEMLTGGKTLDGFDMDQLNADIAAL